MRREPGLGSDLRDACAVNPVWGVTCAESVEPDTRRAAAVTVRGMTINESGESSAEVRRKQPISAASSARRRWPGPRVVSFSAVY